jgi:hypothetical protein
MLTLSRWLPNEMIVAAYAVAWGLGPIPTLFVLWSLPWPRKPGETAAVTLRRRLAPGLTVVVFALAFCGVYVWSTSSVRRSVESVCDSARIGEPPTGIDERARALGLHVGRYQPGVDTSGRPQDAHIYVNGYSIFFYGYSCWISHKDGKVVRKRAAGGEL